MKSTKSYEPTVNPIIAKLKAQAGIQAEAQEENEDLNSESRFSILSDKARKAILSSLHDKDAQAIQLGATDVISHANDAKSIISSTTQMAKQFPDDKKHATQRLSLEDIGLKPGKSNVKSGIYKMAFEDGCYIIGYAGDLYGKMVGVISRINRNIIPRYPRGTEILSFEVLSSEKSDLSKCKKEHADDPKFITKLGRIKAKKVQTSSVIERYKARKSNKEQSKAKSNPAVEAHREQQKKSGGMSALERLRAKGGQLKTIEMPKSKTVSMEIADDALAELDAAFEEFKSL